MKKCLLILQCLALYVDVNQAVSQSPAFSVQDDIGMVRFSDPSASSHGAVAKLSPDHRYFAVVTSRGLIQSNQIESTLSVFDTNEVLEYINGNSQNHSIRPISTTFVASALMAQQSDAYGSVITQLRWDNDSRNLYFIAETTQNDQRLFRMEAKSGKVVPLTPEGYSVARFDIANGYVACSLWHSRENAPRAPLTEAQSSAARDVTGLQLKSILFPDSGPMPTARELWLVKDARGTSVVTRTGGDSNFRDISWLPEAFSLSPDGHHLIQMQPVQGIPSTWSRYEPASGYQWARIENNNQKLLAPTSLWRLKQYSIVDLQNGSSRALIDAPHDYALLYPYGSHAVWSGDGEQVLVTNTFLSLGKDRTDDAERVHPCAIANVEVSTRYAHCVVSVQELASRGASVVEDSITYGRNNGEVSFVARDKSGNLNTHLYHFDGHRWKENPVNSPQHKDDHTLPLTVSVKQSLNDRPVLWGIDAKTQHSKVLWDPNPSFNKLKFGEATVYRWKDETGYEWTGGLIKPVDYMPGKQYPLVIQIYNFDPKQFITDGLYPTAMAARHLASAGIMVLQMQRRLPHVFGIREASEHLYGFEAAIDRLSDEGLVDRRNVGIVGFSSTCWYVEYALIKAPTLFKAATIADGVDFSYMQYRFFGVSSQAVEKEYEETIGAKPIGEAGLRRWIENAPNFNLEHVTTPLRIEAIAPMSILSEWELYSSLKMQDKAVDMVYFPQGQHILQNPAERIASQQGNVDWFSFWLLDHINGDPLKREQYSRWNELKKIVHPAKEGGIANLP